MERAYLFQLAVDEGRSFSEALRAAAVADMFFAGQVSARQVIDGGEPESESAPERPALQLVGTEEALPGPAAGVAPKPPKSPVRGGKGRPADEKLAKSRMEQLVALLRQYGPTLKNDVIVKATGIHSTRIAGLLRRASDAGLIRLEGNKRSRRIHLLENAVPQETGERCGTGLDEVLGRAIDVLSAAGKKVKLGDTPRRVILLANNELIRQGQPVLPLPPVDPPVGRGSRASNLVGGA